MKIIMALGNPGKKYENTWHNIGFLAIDRFLKDNNFSSFEFSKKLGAEISNGDTNKEKIMLAKPQTYMNESGKSVKAIMDFYKLAPSDFIIVHDDIDLLVSKIKISLGRGSAGHKGVESIFNETKNQDFIRLRIGIKTNDKKAMEVVLKKIKPSDAKKAVKKAAEALEFLLKEGLEKTMTKYNK